MSQEDIQDGSPRLMRSCNEKIQNDSINAPSSQQFVVEGTRSQKDIEDIDGAQLLVQFKQERQPYEKPQLNIKRKKHPKKTEKEVIDLDREEVLSCITQKVHPDFGTDILESESVSIDEEVIKKFQDDDKCRFLPKKKSQSFRGLQSKHRKVHGKRVKLNIVLVGRSGIGKTSFIDSFCNKKYEISSGIRERTEQMKTYEYSEAKQHHQIDISLIDIPGFHQINLESYLNLLQKTVYDAFDKHFVLSRGKNISKHTEDCRIHCCIFFISGPWVNEYEWVIMKRIESMVNIIPVIAKGDTFTTAELKHFKKKIFQKNRTEQINLFSLQQIIRQNYPDKLNRLVEGSFGKSPPFVITCCTEKYYNESTKAYELARGYRWGKCELENDDHNDFKFLKHLILNCLSDALINSTDLMQKRYLEMRGKQKDNEERLNSQLSFQFSSVRINHSQRSQHSGDSSIIDDSKGINGITLVQIGLSILGVVGVYYWFKKSKSSQ